MECLGATASPTPTAPSTITAAIPKTAQRRRRRFPAAVRAAPAGWTGLPRFSVGQPGPLEARPTGAAGTRGASGPAGADRTTSAPCCSGRVAEPGRWWATDSASVDAKVASGADGLDRPPLGARLACLPGSRPTCQDCPLALSRAWPAAARRDETAGRADGLVPAVDGPRAGPSDPAPPGLENESRAGERAQGQEDAERLRLEQDFHREPVFLSPG